MEQPSPTSTDEAPPPDYPRLLGRMEAAASIALLDLKYGDIEGAAMVLARALNACDDGNDRMESVAFAASCVAAVCTRARGLAGVAELRQAATDARAEAVG